LNAPESISAAQLERMMKLQDVILKAMAKKITWMAAAEIAGVTDRTMRRIKQRYEEFGYDGLFDQRRGKRSVHRVPMETAERVLALFQEKYFDLSVLHFHEKAGRGAWDRAELQLGQAGVAGRRPGSEAE
jgi:transposase